MKTNLITAVFFLLAVSGCSKQSGENNNSAIISPDSFSVRMPEVTQEVGKVVFDSRQEACVMALNNLGFNTLLKVYEGESSTISPISLYLALGMLASGCEGDSLRELLSILGSNDGIVLKDFCHSLLLQLPAVDMCTKLRLANTLIVDDRYRLNQTYRKSVADYFYAPVENLPFGNPDLVLSIVNEWCNDATEGLIPTIIDKIDNSFMFIMNALYFKAGWMVPFAEEQVRKRPFNGGEQVDFLCEQSELQYVETDSFKMVRRPFSTGKFAFDIILPNEEYSVSDILASLATGEWSSSCNIMKEQLLNLRFPIIDIEVSYDLLDVLQSLGVRKVFSHEAELSPMFESEILYPGKVIHRSKVTVDKSGIESAAVSVVTMDTSATPPGLNCIEFDANRPFIYIISETSSGIVLYSGIFS